MAPVGGASPVAALLAGVASTCAESATPPGVSAKSCAGFRSAEKSLDFDGGRTSGSRLAGGPFPSGPAVEREAGRAGGTGGLLRAFDTLDTLGTTACGPVFVGRTIGGGFFGSFGEGIAARVAAIDALLGDPSRSELGAWVPLLGATSGRIAGKRVVESMRVGGTSSPSAIE